MELTRTEIIAGMLREYDAFATLVDSLDEDAWQTTSRCDGWEVRDVAGHVIGLAEDVAAGVPGSRNSAEEAASVRGDAPAVAAKRLVTALEGIGGLAAVVDDDEVWDGPSGVPDLTMGDGILTLWYDTYVHGEDVRAATGRPTGDRTSLRGAVEYLRDQLAGRGFGPARIAFSDTDIDLDDAVIAPDGNAPTAPTNTVAAADFVLAATGRTDAAPLGLDPAVNIYAE